MKPVYASVSATVLALFLASPAYSADINGGMKDGQAPSAFDAPEKVNWTGFYIQGQGGIGNANHNVTVQEYTQVRAPTPAKCSAGALNGAGTGCVDPAATFTAADDGKGYLDLFNLDGLSSTGFIGGGRVGFDVARGRFLFGVFGEYNVSTIKSEASVLDGGNPIDGPIYADYSLEKGDEWSVGARAGILVNPRTLAYVMAAYTQTDYSLNGLSADDIKDGWKNEQTFSGVSVGGGIEYALASNIFVGMEYTHTFYGSQNWLDQKTGELGEVDCGDTRVTDDLDEDKIMMSVKLKLNAGLPGLID